MSAECRVKHFAIYYPYYITGLMKTPLYFSQHSALGTFHSFRAALLQRQVPI
jgi:hypothetical protein